MAKTKTNDFLKRFRIESGRGFRLKDFDPADTHGFKSKQKAEDRLAHDIDRLSELQQKLYAQDRWALLVVLQAMDAAGKDGTVKHVMSGVNPEGCDVVSFKTPTPEELDHDYLWRTTLRLPERGRIGIFNRSYYEDVLILRVHPEMIETNKLPPSLVSGKVWKERYEDINAYERHLGAERHGDPEIFPAPFARRTAQAIPGAPGPSAKKLEIFTGRRARARLLEKISEGLRRGHPRDRHAPRAVVRGAGRSQMVFAAGGGRRDRRTTRGASPSLPGARQG
jgi:hypothetical protein